MELVVLTLIVLIDWQVSELTADLAEEHSTSTLATERLEAETALRMKLDKELNDLEASHPPIHPFHSIPFSSSFSQFLT